jgi:4a-hydroxytetrahydrobiopterin dehydratase
MRADAKEVLTREVIDRELQSLPDWSYRLGGLHAVFRLPTARDALTLMAAVGEIAEEQNHHPDVDWRYNRLLIRLTSHDVGGEVTQRDLLAAAAISQQSAAAGGQAEPADA